MTAKTPDIQFLYIEQSLALIRTHVTDVVDDAGLMALVRAATAGRASSAILSRAGAYSVRVLAAFVLQQDSNGFTPQLALDYVLTALHDRIGCREGEWMNSLAVIGRRLLGAAYDRGFGDTLFRQRQ